MKLLLDTHVLLWSLLEPDRLKEDVAFELNGPSNDIWLSPITTWEIMILVEKGRVILNQAPQTWIRSIFEKIPFKQARINHEVAIQSRLMKLSHQDPADRFLAATAMVYDLTLVTADSRLLSSKQFSVLPA
jgi:PIN domain nuclease of toxin-antitoxin system